MEDEPAPPPAAEAKGLGEFVLHVDPAARTSKLYRLKPGGSDKLKQLGPKLRPESVDNLSIEQDGTAGSGTVNNVELVTESYSGAPGGTDYVVYDSACSGYKGSPIYCAKVTLRSFYTRTLNNAYVQVTSVVDATSGADVSSTNGATGGDASPSSPNTAIDPSRGLWRYPQAGSSPSFLAGGSVTPQNAATREWTFNNANNASTYVFLRVDASLTYKDYTFTTGSAAFVNACSGTNDHTPTSTDTAVTLPFGFTFYDQQAVTSALYNRNGVVAFGGNAPPSGANTSFQNVALPENPNTVSTSPGVYVFWDKLNYNKSATSLCHVTLGSAPNRQFVFGWRNMKGFGTADNSTKLSFCAILNEGTDTIDFVYGTMTGAAGNDTTYPALTNQQRANGANAVIGVQGKGTGASTNIASPFPAGLGSTDASTGKAYRATPIF